MPAITPDTKTLGGGFGGVVGGFIIDELQTRAHVLLTTYEIIFIMIFAGVLVSTFVPDILRRQLEGQVESLKGRLDLITGSDDNGHPPYTPAGAPILTSPTTTPPAEGSPQ